MVITGCQDSREAYTIERLGSFKFFPEGTDSIDVDRWTRSEQAGIDQISRRLVERALRKALERAWRDQKSKLRGHIIDADIERPGLDDQCDVEEDIWVVEDEAWSGSKRGLAEGEGDWIDQQCPREPSSRESCTREQTSSTDWTRQAGLPKRSRGS